MIYNEMAPRFRSRNAYINEWQKEAAIIASMDEYSELNQIITDYASRSGSPDNYIKIMGQLHRLALADLRYLFAVSLFDGELRSEKIHSALVKYLLSSQMYFFNFERQRLNSQNGEDNRRRPTTIFFSGQLVAFAAVFANQSFFHNCINFVLDQFVIPSANIGHLRN